MLRYSVVVGLSIAMMSCASRNTGRPSETSSATREESAPPTQDRPPAAHKKRASAGGDEEQSARRARTDADDSGDSALKQEEAPEAEPSVFAQGNDEIDLDLTQRIRKQLMADDALSFSAKNVKVITQDGIVTLRGSVPSAAEAKEVRSKAIAEAGQGRVNDQLEVSE